MPCTAKLQITTRNEDGKKTTTLLPISSVPNANVIIDQIAEAILKADKEKRSQIAAALREASVQTLTEDDIKNHQFVSNTTLKGLQHEIRELAVEYPDFTTDETPIIIKASKIQLNGCDYYGRVLDSKGQEIFIIRDKRGAKELFKYLDAKNKIKKAIEDSTLSNYTNEYQTELGAMTDKYGLSLEELLLNYLDDKKQYKPFKTKDGQTIIPFKTLGAIYNKLVNKQTSSKDKSDMQLLLDNINKEKKDQFKYVINFNTLNANLGLLVENVPQWNDMTNDEVIAYLKELFSSDARLIRAKINIVGGQRKVSDWEVITQEAIKSAWSNFVKKQDKDLAYPKFNELVKLAKDSPEQAIGQLSSVYPNATISFDEGQFKVKNPIYKDKQKKVSQAELKEAWKENLNQSVPLDTALKNNEKNVLKYFRTIYPEADIKVDNKGKLQISYNEASYNPKEVVITFPWSTFEEVYDWGYNTQQLFSPVNEDDVKNGMYHGAYIYEFRKGNATHYAISRNLIAPNSYVFAYNTLEGAKAKIDDWNNKQILNDYSLYNLKTFKSVPRTSFLDMKNLKEGQIVTTLDIELPHISRLAGIFYDAITGTVPKFKETFHMIPNIDKIETPEQAAAFTYLFFKYLRSMPIQDMNKALFKYKNEGADIIDKILNAKTKSYFIENLNGKEGTLKLLKNNGNNVDITNPIKSANALSIADMETAIKYFNKKLGLNITSITQSELNEIAKENKFSPNGVRAFILNGDIYINSSNANIADLFHELTHIFLGALKVNKFEAYQQIIDNYRKTKEFARTLPYIERNYQNFAEQDKIEECVADVVAEQLAKTNSLAETFVGEEFSQLFGNIFSDFKEILNGSDTSGLAFNTIFDKEAFIKNTRLTTFIKDNIQNGKIKEFGCQ